MIASDLLEIFLSGRAREDASPLLNVLAEAITVPGPMSQWRRRPSLCHDGTPLVLSLKLVRQREFAFRVLVEPGDLTMSVPEQIQFSLAKLDRMLQLQGWWTASTDLNAILVAVLPQSPVETLGWWGGVWLGASVCPGRGAADEVRVYLNLRDGDRVARWRRVADVFECFRGPNSNPVRSAFGSSLASITTPVGLGVAIAGGRTAGIRLYVVIDEGPQAVATACEVLGPRCIATLVGAYEDFAARFGPLPERGLTVGYDFPFDIDSVSRPLPGRIKVELCCQAIDPNRRNAALSWAKEVATRWSLDADPIEGFIADLEKSRGRATLEFVSLGFTRAPEHVTAYVKPALPPCLQ